jgi:hypothetical protein
MMELDILRSAESLTLHKMTGAYSRLENLGRAEKMADDI